LVSRLLLRNKITKRMGWGVRLPTRKGPVRTDFEVRTEVPPCLDELGGDVAIRGAAIPLGTARLQARAAAKPKDPRRTLAGNDLPATWAKRFERAEMAIRIPASRKARCRMESATSPTALGRRCPRG